jgi:lambda repressor-like predicted transcriptional regulator
MGAPHSNKVREAKRAKFAKLKRKGHSVKASSAAAGISTSTARSWNKGSGWGKGGGWDKADGWSK